MNIADYLRPHVALAAKLAKDQGQGAEAARWEEWFNQAANPLAGAPAPLSNLVSFATTAPEAAASEKTEEGGK